MAVNNPGKPQRHPGAVFIVVGIVMCTFWLMGFMAQIQTNEAAAGWGGVINGFKPDWEILMQPVLLVFGQLGAAESLATFVAYAIESLFVVCIVLGFERVQHATSRNGVLAGKLFLVAALGILIYNSRNDFVYGTFPIGTGNTPHIVFMTTMIIVVGFFGTIGMYCLEIGWSKS